MDERQRRLGLDAPPDERSPLDVLADMENS
jgi:hypothetical protein